MLQAARTLTDSESGMLLGKRHLIVDRDRVKRRSVAQPALAKYGPVEWKPGGQYVSDEDLVRLVGDIATTIFHSVGTTKMGADTDVIAVLDARLKVRHVEGLRSPHLPDVRV